MSGWQRIGVVISVLWLVGPPLYVMIGDHYRVRGYVVNCSIGREQVIEAHERRILDITERRQIEDRCLEEASPLSWGKLATLLLWDKQLRLIAWFLLLGPIILLWLVGWIVLSTVRWIQRGFTGPGR